MLIAATATVVVALLGCIAVLWIRMRRLDAERQQAIDELARANVAHSFVNQRLARANEGLEAFVHSASHDLKAPIRHIHGFCEFVRNSAADRLSAEEQQDLERVIEAATQLSNLLDSLLRFARLGATSLHRESFPLAELIDVVVSRLPSQQQASVDYVDLPTISGDRALLTIVMQNLIENGLKYVTAESPRVMIQASVTPHQARVAVIDNGIGVPAENREKIFQLGFRGVSDTEFAGTGFGLAASARIVHAHGGTIGVEPNQGPGSTFWFTIPQDA